MTYSRSRPSPRFLELLDQYRAMHRDGDARHGMAAEHTFDGRSLPRQAYRIRKLIAATGARTLLAYGTGKGKQYLPNGIMENGVVDGTGMMQFGGVHSPPCRPRGSPPFST